MKIPCPPFVRKALANEQKDGKISVLCAVNGTIDYIKALID